MIVTAVDRVMLHEIRQEHEKAEELTETIEFFVEGYYG